MHSIGTLQESSLHAALKTWYAQPGDQFEVPVDGSIIDIVRGDLLIEIQTRNFMGIKRKLARLTGDHAVRLVYPIPREKWIVRLDADGQTQISRRKSPARGRAEHVFMELVNLAPLVLRPNFSLELLFIREEEVWAKDVSGGPRRWRHRGWRRDDRRLIEVLDRRILATPEDFRPFLPDTLCQPFTNRDLAAALSLSRLLAQRMSYCLRCAGVIDVIGKRGRSHLYQLVPSGFGD